MKKERNIKINVEYLTRVEGHGNIVVDVKEGELKTCQLQITEAPRFFEAMLKGRTIFEAQHISSRICGICACGHSLASIQAAEAAIRFTPSPQTEKLRELLLCLENFDSHLLHIYLLAVPDLLGAKSFIPLLSSHEEDVKRALKLKSQCNTLCDLLVGRHVHPISATIGGFTKLPTKEDLSKMRTILLTMRSDIEKMVTLSETLKFPSFERETEYVSLKNMDQKYPLLHGTISSSKGVNFEKQHYLNHIKEFNVPHSTAKHAKLSTDSYAVGALARFNLSASYLHPKAKKTAEKLCLSPLCKNPYKNTLAQVVECVHYHETALTIVEHFLDKGIDRKEEIVVGLNEQKRIKINAGEGVGAIEVPRGLLFHHYEVDKNGIIKNANCIIPTSQNVNNIERDMKSLIKEILPLSDEEIQQHLEMLVRAYDPCISCSSHFLDVKIVNR